MTRCLNVAAFGPLFLTLMFFTLSLQMISRRWWDGRRYRRTGCGDQGFPWHRGLYQITQVWCRISQHLCLRQSLVPRLPAPFLPQVRTSKHEKQINHCLVNHQSNGSCSPVFSLPNDVVRWLECSWIIDYVVCNRMQIGTAPDSTHFIYRRRKSIYLRALRERFLW